jgi:hypothetical protein
VRFGLDVILVLGVRTDSWGTVSGSQISRGGMHGLMWYARFNIDIETATLLGLTISRV